MTTTPEPKPRRLAFVDVETSGLDPTRHEIWEIAVVIRDWTEQAVGVVDGDVVVGSTADDAGSTRAWVPHDEIRVWQVPIDESLADPVALTVGGYYDRWIGSRDWFPGEKVEPRVAVAQAFAALTHDAILIGANPTFDVEFLRRFLLANRACPGWHYRPVDVEALSVGYLLGSGRADEIRNSLPWSSTRVAAMLGVPRETMHEARADALWAADQFLLVFGQPPIGPTVRAEVQATVIDEPF